MLDGSTHTRPNHSKRQKAAIILRYLMSQGQALPLDALPEEVQIALTRELGALPDIDQTSLATVAAEFNAELEALALSSGEGLKSATETLSPYLSADAKNRLLNETLGAPTVDPWANLARLDLPARSHLAATEAPEVVAIWLVKLPVSEAADLLRTLEGPTARRIAQTMSRIDSAPPELIARVGSALATHHCTAKPKGFVTPSGRRVADILNASDSATREALLAALEEETPDFASTVRRAIFTFEDITDRIFEKDIPQIVRSLGEDTLCTALAYAQSRGGAEAKTADYILSNISKRLSANLAEAILERGEVSGKDGDAAQRALVSAIKSLEEKGELSLRLPPSD